MNFTKSVGILAVMAGASASHAAINLTFDENGNATGATGIMNMQRSDGLPASVAVGTLATSPVSSGGGATTLDYLLPESTSGANLSSYPEFGWLVVYAPGTSVQATGDANQQGSIVDLVHFDNSDQANSHYQSLFFYSYEDGSPSNLKASPNFAGNSGISSSTLSAILGDANTVSLVEGPGGVINYNPANYFGGGGSAPGSGILYSPSTHLGGTTVQYTYTFDSAVPEPTTLIAGALLVTPFGASFMRVLRRKRAT